MPAPLVMMLSAGNCPRSHTMISPKLTAPGWLGRLLGPGEVVVMRGLGLGAPADLVRRLQPFERGRKAGRRGVDREVGPVDAAELAGVRMHVDEFHLRVRNVEQRVALRRHLAEPPADQQHQVGALDARDHFRVRPDAEIAGVAGMRGGKEMQAAERGDHRQGRSARQSASPPRRRPPTSGCRRAA